jgi:replicative DNA helicase
MRPEDARIYSQIFQPDWLKDPVMRQILGEIYKFTKEHGVPPTVKVLDQIFYQEDDVTYAGRYKPALDKIRNVEMELPEQIYLMEQAKNVAITRSLEAMYADMDFQTKMVGQKGQEILADIAKWIQNFTIAKNEDSGTLTLAWERLVNEQMSLLKQIQAPTSIDVIDSWTFGGLRSKQMGILMAPTGEGKSAMLLNFAFNQAIQDEWNIWFVTNELSLHEQAERLLSRITQVPLPQIQHEVGTVDTNFKQKWPGNIDKRLRITSVNADITTNELENLMMREAALSGWKPNIIILDFMERMNPNDTGYDRRAEWQWMGAIAKDLVRLARAHNVVLWTACQTNRSGKQADKELSIEMAQASIRHFQEASVVIGMRKGWSTDDEEALEIKPLKNRHGKVVRNSVFLKCDLEKMYISNTEVQGMTLNLSNDEEEGDSKDSENIASKANPRSTR